nr:hypothetical protein GCM10020092_074230 [Actinoplanes digitatis]
MTDPADGTSRWEYNAIGDVTRKIGTDGTAVSFAYDGARRRTAMTDTARHHRVRVRRRGLAAQRHRAGRRQADHGVRPG